MNCSKCQELLLAHLEGLLDRPEERDLALHLQSCEACRIEAEGLAGLRERLLRDGSALAGKPLGGQVMDRIFREQAFKVRRITMLRKYGKRFSVAAAAIVLLAGAVAVLRFVGAERLPTFVELVEASEAAAARVDSLHYSGTIRTGGELIKVETYIKNPFLTRSDYADGSYLVIILDKTSFTMCHYVKDKNVFTKTLVPRTDLDDDVFMFPMHTETTATSWFSRQMYMSFVEQAPETLRETEAEELVIKGKPAYRLALSLPDKDVDVFFDKASGLLMRMVDKSDEGRIMAELVEVNPNLDDSLFSTEPPEGAKVVEQKAPEMLSSPNP